MKPYSLYTKKVMKHFKKPHNMGTIKNPDGVGKVGNPLCGDVMWLYIKVKKDKDGKVTKQKNYTEAKDDVYRKVLYNKQRDVLDELLSRLMDAQNVKIFSDKVK